MWKARDVAAAKKIGWEGHNTLKRGLSSLWILQSRLASPNNIGMMSPMSTVYAFKKLYMVYRTALKQTPVFGLRRQFLPRDATDYYYVCLSVCLLTLFVRDAEVRFSHRLE